jgi:hypothetical protein
MLLLVGYGSKGESLTSSAMRSKKLSTTFIKRREMGINRWTEMQEDANQEDPNATPHISSKTKGDPSSRLEASKEPAEDEEKRRVSEKLEERERQDA